MQKLSVDCCYNQTMIKLKKRLTFKYATLLAVFTFVVLTNTVSVGAVEIYVDGNNIGEQYIGNTPDQMRENLLELAQEYGLDSTDLNNIHLNTSMDQLVDADNNILSVSILKSVPVEIAGVDYVVDTYVHNVGQLKQEYNLAGVEANFSDDTLLIDILRQNEKLIIESETNIENVDYQLDYSVTYEDTDALYEGEEQVSVEGVNGYYTETTTQVLLDGKVISESTEVTNRVEPINEVILRGTKVKPIPTTSVPSTTSDWNSIAICESSGNWGLDTGNGYYGGLQISESNWNNYAPGLGITAELPHLASADEQILVANEILAAQGWSAWGACSPY